MTDPSTHDTATADEGAETLEVFLRRLVDYAGLFPPAKLPMAEAVDEYARQRRGDTSWMLGRFVVPVGRLDELARAAETHWNDSPWPLSVLAGIDPDAEREALARFATNHAGRATVASLETKASTVEDVERLATAFGASYPEQYVELPSGLDDLDAVMAALAHHGLRAKIRTGGVTADAFPTAAAVARFLVAAADAGVPIKATAGLHHPLRGAYRLTYEPDSALGTMFGFLNVFLAAAFVRRGLRGDDLVRLLEERDPAAFRFDDAGVHWRSHSLPPAALAETRSLGACSYGSCSFAEPVDDLRHLGLLPNRGPR